MAMLAILNVHLFDLFRHVDTGIVIALMDHALKPAVDLLDDLINPGQQLGEEVDGPFLQSFGHDGMVGVGHGSGGQIPCLVPFESVVVHEQSHQLGNTEGRMGIVHLEDQLVGQVGQVGVVAQVLLQSGLQGGGNEEILLFQTQLLAVPVVILGIKNITDRPGQSFLLHGLLVVALVEGLQREVDDGLGVPDPQSIYEAVAIADDGHVIGHSLDGPVIGLLEHGAAARAGIGYHAAIEMDVLGILGPAQLQGIAVLKPVVRNFLLEAVHDLLLEHTVVIADAGTVGGIVQGRQRIEEAGCQSSQTAVAQSRIGLLVFDGIDLEAQFLEGFLDGAVGHQVDGVVAEGAAHEEFHGHIYDCLGILIFECPLGLHPAVDDLILQCQSGSLKDHLLCGFLHGAAVHGPYVVFYASLE